MAINTAHSSLLVAIPPKYDFDDILTHSIADSGNNINGSK